MTEHNTWSRFRPWTEQHYRLAGENSAIEIFIRDALKEETGQRGALQRYHVGTNMVPVVWDTSALVRNRRLSVVRFLKKVWS